MIKEAHDRGGAGRKRENLGEGRGCHKLQDKGSEQDAGQDFSHDPRLLKPLREIAETMHRNQQYGNGEDEVTELDD